MRRIVRLAVALAILGGVAWVGFQVLLGSGYATGKVTDKLQSLLGVPVSIASIEMGVNGSAALGIAIAEHEATTDQPPFLTIGRAETDLGISELIGGATLPGQLTLSDAHLTLRYDRAGQPLTKLPHPTDAGDLIPEIRLARAQVTIQREGEPNCVFQGIDLTVRTTGRTLDLTGTIQDANWGGQWRADAKINGISQTGQASQPKNK
jgi:hypothetical protein